MRLSLNEQLEMVRKEIHEWRELQQHPQFEKLVYGMREQVRSRHQQHYGLLPHSLDALISLGSVNSEIAGIELVLKYPDIILADLQAKEKLLMENINADLEDRA